MENDCTEHLGKCLEYTGFKIIFTATLGTRHSEIWRSRLLDQFDENVFLFRGVPDLVIRQSKSVEMMCGHQRRFG